MPRYSLWIASVCLLGLVSCDTRGADAPPQVGDEALDFELDSLPGKKISLAALKKEGPVVLVVLRGYPGYQCPVCNQQVGTYLKAADDFKNAGAQVVLVYPGPAKDLAERAKEFYADKTIPDHFHLVTDPDYKFTSAYHLRWDARNETAYPSTFVISSDSKVAFAKISKTHGDRTKPEEALEALKKARK